MPGPSRLIAEFIGQNCQAIEHPHSELLSIANIGLELELEGLTDWPTVNGWRREADNSLRDGVEYVFNGAMGGARAVRAIDAMARAMQEARPSPTFRCSTHIHMDVRDMDIEGLRRVVMAYTMLESVMFDHCSPERRYSNFCTPYFVNSYLPRLFSALFTNTPGSTLNVHHLTEWPKYSALNLKPVTNYGSIEFRGSHALLTRDELMGLAQRMLHLKRLALEHDVPPLQFVERVRALSMAELFPTGLRTGYVPDENLLDKGYASALGIASGTLIFPRPARPAPPPPRERDVPNPRVRMNMQVMENYNLFPLFEMRLVEVLRMVKTLREVGGLVNPPSVGDFCDWPRYVSNNDLMRNLERLGYNLRQVGL